MEKKFSKKSKFELELGNIAGYVAFYAILAVFFVLAVGICVALILGLIALNKWLWGLI